MILKYHMRAPGPSPLSYETFCSTNERVDRDTHTATRNLRLDCGRVVPVQGYDGTISDVFYRAARINGHKITLFQRESTARQWAGFQNAIDVENFKLPRVINFDDRTLLVAWFVERRRDNCYLAPRQALCRVWITSAIAHFHRSAGCELHLWGGVFVLSYRYMSSHKCTKFRFFCFEFWVI